MSVIATLPLRFSFLVVPSLPLTSEDFYARTVHTIYDYMRRHAALLGDRIRQEYPALHQFDDAVSPRIEGLLRTPFPAQTIAITGVAKP